MPKKLILILLGFLAFTASAQQTLALPGAKQYPATNPWDFSCENYAFGGSLRAQVGKTEKGGVLELSIPVSSDSFYIGGTIYLFLSDNTVITCTDKNLRENKEGRAIAYYTFSPVEMNKLKTAPIRNIRFWIKGKESAFSSHTGYFMAENKKDYLIGYDKSSINMYATETEIRSLYLKP